MREELEDLQVRFTHQELAIEVLNQAVVRQDQLIVEMRRELARLQEIVRELRPSPLDGDPAHEPPPPHY
ncbi:MAG TPA: SlyX family protein [Gammaproteobacteria bacterium]|nr:SlyX family protein [Chromatiaceae bacterium]MCP5440977.1 SlyX family protein [Chromatiaceae bacterium]HPE80159.1 SlyX family protein [Gammaproteobacteria bacterium]